jgi:hypothetical protein
VVGLLVLAVSTASASDHRAKDPERHLRTDSWLVRCVDGEMCRALQGEIGDRLEKR